MPVDHRGKQVRRQGANLRLAFNSRASFPARPHRNERRQQASNLRMCPTRATRRLQPVGHASRAEAAGIELRRRPTALNLQTPRRGDPGAMEWGAAELAYVERNANTFRAALS